MKKSKELEQVGQKCRSERLVSTYIRAIGDEKTVVNTPDDPDPDNQMPEFISKAEALARDIWKEALDGEDKKLKLEYRKLLLDRIEGKPGTPESNLPKRPRIPDKASEKGKARLNQMVSDAQ